jgi:hypothetical protein
LWWPGNAFADSITGNLELNYNFFSIKTEDQDGNTTKREGNIYNSRLIFDFEKNIYPYLKFRGGGFFEETISDSETNGEREKTVFTRMRPYLDLTAETPLYTAGVRYTYRQDSINPSGRPTQTAVNEEFSSILGWRPDGLPSMELRYIRSSLYDKDRSALDVDRDFVSLISKYSYGGFTADYYGTYTKTKENLRDLKVEDLFNSGRFTYANTFFKDRVYLSTTYNISHQVVKTATGGGPGGGFITTQVFPFGGLSIISDTTDPIITLAPNPALIDGNTTVSAAIDLVSDVPLTRRQMGLDFLIPTEVSQLLVWVDRTLTSTDAGSFSWDIYISDDNLNWTHWAGPISGTFGQFENRFEINFPNVIPARRYIKVVTTPLLRTPLVPPNILVTEIQAFVRTPVSGVGNETRQKTTRTSHIYTLDSKARILDAPNLYYELSYFYTRSDPGGRTRYTLSNGVSANHQFSSVFSGSARVAREDGKEIDEKRVGYIYTASIDATPLRTLRHSLIFSGRNEEIDGDSNSNYSIFLNNIATLYRGIEVNLTGGVNFSEQPTGEQQRDIILNLITTIVPRKDLTLNFVYSDTFTRRSGGERGSDQDNIRRGEVSLAYNPFLTLNLTASLEVVAQKGEPLRTNQNYSVNWSPFRDGALQFNFFYNESIQSEDHSKTRTIVPSVRWYFTRASYLELVYQSTRSSSDTARTEGQIISANVRLFF